MTNIIPFNAAIYFRETRTTTGSRRVKQVLDRPRELQGLRPGDKVRTQQGWAFVVAQDHSGLTITCRGIRKKLLPHHVVPATPEDGIA